MPPAPSYLPALRYDALTRFYDPVMGALLRERTFKSRLVQQAELRPGQRVLDLGCGTATLTLMLQEACPEARVLGLDADPRALELARTKVEKSGLPVELYLGTAVAPPFPDRSFERVVSCLLFHHLPTGDKLRTLRRVHGLLRPGGELHVADWGPAQNPLMRVAFLSVQLLDGFGPTDDSVHGRMLALMGQAGFRQAAQTHQQATPFGTLALYRGVA